MVASILYTERNSPDSIRAMLGISYCDIHCEIREIDLNNPPDVFRMISMRSSLPLLVLSSGAVLEHSLDLLFWAVSTQDPCGLWPENTIRRQSIRNLIETHDGTFAVNLRNYPIAPELAHKKDAARLEAEVFLAQLEARLAHKQRLVGENTSLADAAIFPFVYKLSIIDRSWFNTSPYRNVRRWIKLFLEDPHFMRCIEPRPFWHYQAPPLYINT